MLHRLQTGQVEKRTGTESFLPQPQGFEQWGNKGMKKRQIHKHMEKLGLGLGSLMEKPSSVDAQHIYNTPLSKEVGLLCFS